jgi:hypothetical protein
MVKSLRTEESTMNRLNQLVEELRTQYKEALQQSQAVAARVEKLAEAIAHLEPLVEKKKKYTMSAAARKKISIAQKARWEANKAPQQPTAMAIVLPKKRKATAKMMRHIRQMNAARLAKMAAAG